MARPRVALIIPVRNGEAHMARMLPALRAQSLQPDELLIIDSDTLSLSALNLLHALREQGFGGSVIVLQATTVPAELGHLSDGFDLQVLGKPLQMEQVFAAVEQALQKQAA